MIDPHAPPAAQANAAAAMRTAPAPAPAPAPHRKTVPPGPGMAAAAAAAPQPVATPGRPRTGPMEALTVKPSGVVRTKTVEITRASVDAALAAKEPRRQDRFALAVEVTLGSEHNFYQGFAENISSGGVFVATNDIHPVGTQFELTFTLPEMGRSCMALCEVRWVRDYNTSGDMAAGMGLAFLRIAPADQKAVEVFLRHREPIFFDDESMSS
jgi:type IV pilus assembly protein PilZ